MRSRSWSPASAPPNWALPSDNGGWCNPPRRHFELSQPAFSQIADVRQGIVPISLPRRMPTAPHRCATR
ncbi:RlpA-like double-psi beta-barrel domain-containing protein [Streptomyces spectabilis]|uniref:RlpA-like double-psi beta-barrel domain-containing protein n=1 Tax=Streptomyces spectabilis TaxID=68270 RepID=UPI001CEF67C9